MCRLLQQVRKIVLFINTNQPLHGRSQWDPFARTPTSDDIDDMCGSHLHRCLSAQRLGSPLRPQMDLETDR